MSNVTSLLAAALIAFVIVSSSTASDTMVKCGEDPEFQAAWKALVEKEEKAQLMITNVSLPRSMAHPTLPIEAIGNSAFCVCNAVRNRIHYTPDIGNTWQSAAESWNRKMGDCEDFAIAVRDICWAKGISAEIHVLYSKTHNAGHAVTIGRSAGGMWMSSNGSFERITSEENALNTIVRRYGWSGDAIAAYKTVPNGKQFVETSLR